MADILNAKELHIRPPSKLDRIFTLALFRGYKIRGKSSVVTVDNVGRFRLVLGLNLLFISA